MKTLKYLTILIFLAGLTTGNAQWSNQDLGLTGRAILCFAVKNTNIIAGTNGGLVRSTNNGVNWSNIGGGLPYSNVRALLNVESYPFNILAGMVSGRISMSTNYGDNWTGFPIDSVQLPFLADINCILEKSNSSNFIIGTERGAFLLPHYYPLSNWIAINTGLPSGETKVRAIVENNGEVFIGTNSGVFRLSGFDWVEKNSGLTNTNVTALASINGILFAGTAQGSVGGVYISTDNGSTWTISLNDGWVTSIFNIGSNIFVGSFGNGVWRSTNNGTSWSQINDGLASGAYYVMSLGADDQYLFAGTNGSCIWRRPLSQIVTDVIDHSNIQLTEFSLEQNYPNPFNPSTSIQYTIGSRQFVQLKVYDVLGNEVATLVDDYKPAGSYEIDFNASQLSSGLYMYKLKVGEITLTKKMILIK
jgi:ligand-binding sensor domain-containing protein